MSPQTTQCCRGYTAKQIFDSRKDISFYRDQQNQRLGRMSERDMIYAARIKEKSFRLQWMDAFRAKYTQRDKSEDEEEFSSSSQESDSTDSSTVVMPEMSSRNEYVMLKAPRNPIDHKYQHLLIV